MFGADFGKRFLISYSVLLASAWLFDLNLKSGMFPALESFVATAKWFLTIPAITAGVIAIIFQILSQPSNRYERPRLSEIAKTQPTPAPIPIIKIDPTKLEPEKREAEKSLEAPAFPPVEKTRGPQETLEALLDEF